MEKLVSAMIWYNLCHWLEVELSGTHESFEQRDTLECVRAYYGTGVMVMMLVWNWWHWRNIDGIGVMLMVMILVCSWWYWRDVDRTRVMLMVVILVWTSWYLCNVDGTPRLTSAVLMPPTIADHVHPEPVIGCNISRSYITSIDNIKTECVMVSSYFYSTQLNTGPLRERVKERFW